MIKYKTIAEYIKSKPKEVAARLKVITEIVRKAAPKAESTISYNMPAFKLNGVLIYYAAHKQHIGLYPYPSALKEFKDATAKYITGRGSIQFPNDKPLPISLIRKIVKYRVTEKMHK